MALINQRLENILNGISQQPQALRPSSQGDLQENMLSHAILGLRRRPPTKHIARLGDVVVGTGGDPWFPLPGGTLAAFYRGGVGYKKGAWPAIATFANPADEEGIKSGIEALADAGNGELCSAWLDQTGNRRHIALGTGADYGNFHAIYDATKAPLVATATKELRFGQDDIPTYGSIINVTNVNYWWNSSTAREMLIAFRVDNPTPVADGKNSPWCFNRSGGATEGDSLYPAANGHIREPAMCNISRDLGLVPGGLDLTLNTVVRIRCGQYAYEDPNDFVYLNGTQHYSNHNGGTPAVSGGSRAIGIGISGMLKGHIKHIAVFDGELLDADAAAWTTLLQSA